MATSSLPEIVAIDYQDLVQFCNESSTLGKDGEETIHSDSTLHIRQHLINQIEAAFGPYGLGIVVISNVPHLQEQRQRLLPLGAKVPYLPNIDETLVDPVSFYSVGWSHGKEQLGGGQPDYLKGSYYANPLTDDIVSDLIQRDGENMENYLRQQSALHPEFYAPNIWPNDSLPDLKPAFCQLGQTLVNVGCMVAEVCDAYCMKHIDSRTGNVLNLARTIRQSKNCKGRLLHYFAPDSVVDNNSISPEASSTDTDPIHQPTQEKKENLWCAWHNDHGSLTGLVPAMYLDQDGNEVACPDNRTGLYIQPRQRSGESSIDPVRVQLPSHASSSCILYQIGETSQIQSGGLLQATPHAVIVATDDNNNSSKYVTRESFAVFMEPEFDTPLLQPPTSSNSSIKVDNTSSLSLSSLPFLPSLQQRWKPGQTFGDFHLATVSSFTTS